jgi:hypothetical protein
MEVNVNCADLLYRQDNNENTLHERLKISDVVLKKGVAKKNELIEFLRVELKETFDCDVGFWVQGSYKSHTLIRPTDKFSSYDIDVGIYLFFDAEIEEITSKEVKMALAHALKSFCLISDECELQESKNACEGLKFKTFLTIDTPIYYFLNETIKLATDNGWVSSDPKAIQDYLTNAFEDSGSRATMKRVVRYLKAWVNVKWNGTSYKKLPSLAINVLVAQNLVLKESEDDTFIETALSICNSLNQIFRVNSPIDNSNLLSMPEEAITFAYKKLDELKQTCNMCSESADYRVLLFGNLFEHYFPSLVEADDSGKSNLPALTTVPEISINRYAKNGDHIETTNTNFIKVRKGESLTFIICNQDDFDPSSNVHWTVRNIGQQSNDANDIGHKTITSIDETEKRHTAYTGSHTMECTIFSRGELVGRKIVSVEVKPAKMVIRRKKVFKGFRR